MRSQELLIQFNPVSAITYLQEIKPEIESDITLQVPDVLLKPDEEELEKGPVWAERERIRFGDMREKFLEALSKVAIGWFCIQFPERNERDDALAMNFMNALLDKFIENKTRMKTLNLCGLPGGSISNEIIKKIHDFLALNNSLRDFIADHNLISSFQ